MPARIHAVDRRNRHLYEEQVEEHFRLRYKLCVEDRGWRNLYRDDRRDVDQFDTEDAVYILAIEDGRVLGGSRLNPSTRPTLLSEVFPYLAAKPIPEGPAVFEWTRIFVIPERREEHRFARIGSEVMCGLVEYCLGQGITHLRGVFDGWWLPRFMDLGFDPEPLGLPVPVDGSPAFAGVLSCTEAGLGKLRQTRSVPYRCLAETSRIDLPFPERVEVLEGDIA